MGPLYRISSTGEEEKQMFRAYRLAPFIVAVLASAAIHAADSPPKTDNAAEAAAVGLLDMAFNQRKVAAAFEKYVGLYYRQHNPAAPEGKAPAVEILSKWVAATPTIRYDMKRVISDGDLVVVHSHVTMNPTDRGLAVVDIFRVQKGKVVEHWDVSQPVPEKPANNNTMF
jgi:predicted SnoaL-like aldol condensation-catalyzing enzyme